MANGILACGQSVQFTATYHISQIDFSVLISACLMMRILECQRAHLGAGVDGRERRPIVEFPNPNSLVAPARCNQSTIGTELECEYTLVVSTEGV